MPTGKTIWVILLVVALLAFMGLAFMSTWGCQPGNPHLLGACTGDPSWPWP